MTFKIIFMVLITIFLVPSFAENRRGISHAGSQTSILNWASQIPENQFVIDKNNFLTCMIFVLERRWFQITVHLFSTRSDPKCSTSRFDQYITSTAEAQLRTLYPDANYFRTKGPYFKMASLDLSQEHDEYISVGKLRFYPTGTGNYTIFNGLKDFASYTRVLAGNFTYIPFNFQNDMKLLWFPGAQLHELVAPDGTKFTMILASYITIDDKFLPNLQNLDSILRLPQGWQFRRRTTETLYRVDSSRLAGYEHKWIIDELGNLYVSNLTNK